MSELIYKEILDLFLVIKGQKNIQFAFDYLRKMFEYNLIGGKGMRGQTVVRTYKHLSSSNINKEKLKQADIAGCCIEIVQASFLVHDDIMDNSELRRQKQCWYLKAKEMGYGLIAVNDGLFLNTIVYKILAKYFRSESYFGDLLVLFNNVIFQTCTGQCLDMLTSPSEIDLSKYTQDRYEAIVIWKTAYYSFYLPVMCGMIIAEIKDESLFQRIEKILLKLGEYFQIQDDYLDYYGDAAVMGKIGRDIEEGKCSWLIVQALQLVNDIQMKDLKENYGKEDIECVKKVRKVYDSLGLKNIYDEYEERVYKELNAMILDLSVDYKQIPSGIFLDLLKIMYKRQK